MNVGVTVKRSGTMDGVLRALEQRLGRRVQAGITAAAHALREESNKNTPIDLTALRETSVVRLESYGIYTVAVVGYGPAGVTWTGPSTKEKNKDGTPKIVEHTPAEYAVPVHQGVPGHVYVIPGYNPPLYLEKARTEKLDVLRAAFNEAVLTAV